MPEVSVYPTPESPPIATPAYQADPPVDIRSSVQAPTLHFTILLRLNCLLERDDRRQYGTVTRGSHRRLTRGALQNGPESRRSGARYAVPAQLTIYKWLTSQNTARVPSPTRPAKATRAPGVRTNPSALRRRKGLILISPLSTSGFLRSDIRSSFYQEKAELESRRSHLS